MALHKLVRSNYSGKSSVSIKSENVHSFKEGYPWKEKNMTFTWLSSLYNPFKEKRNVIEFNLRNVSVKKLKETKRARIRLKALFLLKNIFCLQFSLITKTLIKKKKSFLKFSFFEGTPRPWIRKTNWKRTFEKLKKNWFDLNQKPSILSLQLY